MSEENREILFTRAPFGGYRAEEVDEYVDNMSIHLDAQQTRIAELTEKMRYLVRVIENMRSGDAQGMSVEQANSESKKIIADAKAEADRIIRSARTDADMIRRKAGDNCSAEKTMLFSQQKEFSEKSISALRELTVQTMNGILQSCNEEAGKIVEMRDRLLAEIDSEKEQIRLCLDQQETKTEYSKPLDNEPAESGLSDEEGSFPEKAAEVTPDSGKAAEKKPEESASDPVAEKASAPETADARQQEPGAEDLNLDEWGFAALREGISVLAEENYIPGQEEPTIVPNSLQDVEVKKLAVNPKKNPIMPEVKPEIKKENETDADDGDDEIRFSFFRKK